jgi:Tol biopolymer transport system component
MRLKLGNAQRGFESTSAACARRVAHLTAIFLVMIGTLTAQDAPMIATPAPAEAEAPKLKPGPIAAVYELKGDPPEWKKLFDLPDNHRCNSPRVTADGRRLMFDGWNKVAGETNTASKVFLCNLDGTELKSICAGAMPCPSPDGKRFACSRYHGAGGVWMINIDGGEELVDQSGWGIQWSPDGASVAYTHRNNIVIRTLATGQVRTLFPAAGSPYRSIAWNMSWSADSKKIAFLGSLPEGGYDLATVDVLGAELGFARRTSGNLVPSITWNAEGRPIVYPDKVGKVYRMLELDPAGQSEPRLIPGIPADSKATSATWSPDGSRLIVICNFN